VKAVAIGGSWGGLYALMELLGSLPTDFPCPVLVVQHRANYDSDEHRLAHVLSRYSALPVTDADDREAPRPGHVYLAPADYHLLVEDDRFELTVDEFVHYSRPSIDVLFESVARAYGREVVGVLLTGFGRDGTAGMKAIKSAGGVTIAEDPETAMQAAMPRSAIEAGAVGEVLELDEIAPRLIELCGVTA
jgi:two-component system, chemotaxis family, protein-glutamate methylesterase/glutaminase